MRIVFIGTVEFSLRALQLLVRLQAEVVGVVTRDGSSFNADFADLTGVCNAARIPYRFASNVNEEETLSWLRELRPDVIFCFGWSSLLKKEVLNLAPLGVIGFHPAPLPRFRGRHPIIWAVALGLTETASTFFYMDEGADSGDLLSQRPVPILASDDAGNVYRRVTDTALAQIEEFLPLLAAGSAPRIPQDHLSATYWRKRSAADGKIDWRMSGSAIVNLVRALARPYPGADMTMRGQSGKVWKAEAVAPGGRYDGIEPGMVTDTNPAGGWFEVRCYDGIVRVLEADLSLFPEKGEYL